MPRRGVKSLARGHRRTLQRPASVEGNLGARQRQGSSLLEASGKVSFLGAASCALKQTKPRVWLGSFGFAFSGNVLLCQAVLEASKTLVCRRMLERFWRDLCVRSSQLRKGPLTTSVSSLFAVQSDAAGRRGGIYHPVVLPKLCLQLSVTVSLAGTIISS